MGAKFIAAREGMAVERYREMLVASELDEVILTSAVQSVEEIVDQTLSEYRAARST